MVKISFSRFLVRKKKSWFLHDVEHNVTSGSVNEFEIIEMNFN